MAKRKIRKLKATTPAPKPKVRTAGAGMTWPPHNPEHPFKNIERL